MSNEKLNVEALELDAGQLFEYQGELYVCQQILTDANDIIQNVVVMKVGNFQQGTSTPRSAFIGPWVITAEVQNFNPYATVRIITD